MEYSPIKSIRTKNFMCLGDVHIDFEGSPIISLIGENDSGKTAFIKSVAVCASNAFETEQKSYIRSGAIGFGIAIELEDGTNVIRIKRKDVNRYEVDKPGKEAWITDKIDRGYGTPKEVEDVMGFVVEPETKELLNVRTYENRCLFVLTKASENYKVMYNALKVDNITRAMKEGNKQANTCKNNITSCEKSIDTLEKSLKRIKIVDTKPIILIKERIKNEIEQLELLERAKILIDKNNKLEKELGAINKVINTEEISELEVLLLNKIKTIIERDNEIVEKNKIYLDVEQLGYLEYDTEEKLERVINIIDETNRKREQNKSYDLLNEMVDIDEMELNIFNNILKRIIRNNELYNRVGKDIDSLVEINLEELDILNKLNKLYQLNYVVGNCENAIKQLDDYERQCNDVLKQLGVKVVSCPKCGEDVIIEDLTGNEYH